MKNIANKRIQRELKNLTLNKYSACKLDLIRKSMNHLDKIQTELKDLKLDTDSACKLDSVGNSTNQLIGQIVGPTGTPYEGGTYQLSFDIPTDYPFSPPKVKFITKVWHPNVSSVTGAICLDVLKDNWSSTLTLQSVMLSVQALMSAPEPDKPQDAGVVASQYKHYREKFKQIAQYWAHKYAGASTLDVASYDDLVNEVVAMGLSEKDAVRCLSNSNFDLQDTIQKINEWVPKL